MSAHRDRRGGRGERLHQHVAGGVGRGDRGRLGVVVGLLPDRLGAVGRDPALLRDVHGLEVGGLCPRTVVRGGVPPGDDGVIGRDRDARVQVERQRRGVAGHVGDDQRVDALDGTERTGHDTVQIGPHVVGQILRDAVQREPRDLVRVVELEADRAVDPVAALRLRLDRDGRAGGVERERDRRGVAGDVVHDEGVEALDRAELSGLDPVQVGPHVVGEVLDDAVERELVDLVRVVQLEADVAEQASAALRLRLDRDGRADAVDGERLGLGLREVAGGIQRVELDRVGAVRDGRDVDREVGRLGAALDRDLVRLQQRAAGVDVGDDLGDADVVGGLDGELVRVGPEQGSADVLDDGLGGVGRCHGRRGRESESCGCEDARGEQSDATKRGGLHLGVFHSDRVTRGYACRWSAVHGYEGS